MLTETDAQLALPLTDDALLRRYISSGDVQDLTELINRYAPMVYAAARRQVRDADFAEDIMQNVFITFAGRVRQIRFGAAVGAWLLKTTRFTAANEVKIRARRRRHEQKAAAARSELVLDGDPALRSEEQWESIEPLLDGAISRLRFADQSAVILRFFRGLSLREVAEATGATEEGVRKRISRAVSRLRKDLLRRGAEPTACAEAALGALLASHAVEPVPVRVLAHLPQVANSTAKLAGGSFFHGVVTMSTKAKVAASIALAFLIVGGGIGAIEISGMSQGVGSPVPPPAIDAAPPLPDAPDDVTSAFSAVYALAPDQYCKYIPVPFIPERGKFISKAFRSGIAPAMRQTVSDPDCVRFEEQADGSLIPRRFTNLFGNGTGLPGGWAHNLAIEFTNRPTWQIEFDDDLRGTRLPGDWVIRAGATTDEILQGMKDVASAKLGRRYGIVHDQILHDVLVATGRATAHPGDFGQYYQPLHLRSPLIGLGRDTGGGAQLFEVLDYLSDLSGQWIVNETGKSGGVADHRFIVYKWDAKHIPDDGGPRDRQVDELMGSVSRQTGLTFKHESRTVDVWTVAAVSPK